MKTWLRDKIIFPLVNLLPRRLRGKIKMAGTCLFGNGWGYLILSRPTGDIRDVTPGQIKELYAGFPDRSLDVLLDYYKYVKLIAPFSEQLEITRDNILIVPLRQLFPGLEAKVEKEEKICRKLRGKVGFDSILPEVFCYHHGLKFLDSAVLKYIEKTVFLDLGAFVGDSAYVLAQYNPAKILAFEPSVRNGEQLVKNLRREKVADFELLPLGISDREETLRMNENGLGSSMTEHGGSTVEVVSVDGFLKQHEYGKIGLIKADLEGMGLKMVKGALETIRRDRPVLLLAIYHNRDEFLGIYGLLKENLHGYHYRVEALAGFHEITLIGWPDEALAKD